MQKMGYIKIICVLEKGRNIKQMNFSDNQSKMCNVITADSCKNIEAALQYVTETPKVLSSEAITQVQNYIMSQIKNWSEKSNKKLSEQEIMYGLIRSQVLLQGTGDLDDTHPVDMRYAVEFPMRIPLMRYGVRSNDDKSVRRMAFLTDMLFDDMGKVKYETQRLFLETLMNKLTEGTQENNVAQNDMVKVLLNGVKRSVKERDCWSVFLLDEKTQSLCGVTGYQVMEPYAIMKKCKPVNMHTQNLQR